MSLLTFITVLVVLYGLLGRRGYGVALALGGATAAGTAVALGAAVVPTFYAVALGAVVGLGVRLLGHGRGPHRPREPLPPGSTALLLFLAWSTLVTLVAPLLFDGQPVVVPGATQLIAGVVTTSNIAQVGYLALGVCVVVFLARSPSARPELVGLATGLTVVLSFWRYLSQLLGLPFPEGVFDNSPSFAYIETAAGNIPRFRGILSEPAGLAGACLVAIGYLVPRAHQLAGWRRAGCLTLAGIALYLGVISTSATFVVAGVAVTAMAAGASLIGFLSRTTSLSRVLSVVGCLAAVVALWVLPIVAEFVEATVNEKVSSSSFDERSSANADSISVFLDTYGFGVGLGASRASSFVPTLLAATGFVGALLFTVAVVTLVRRAWPLPAYRPVIWALVTLLVVKIAAGPDLSDSTGVFWISLGLLSHAVLTARTEAAADVVEPVLPAALGPRATLPLRPLVVPSPLRPRGSTES